MKEFIKKLKRGVRGLFNYCAWYKQYKAIISEPHKSNFVLNRDWYKGRKILMMVPHADDELISSYTVLSNVNDVTVYYCGFTGSNHTEGNRIIRRNEILKLCSELNAEVVEGNGMCENLGEVLNKGNYDTILLPSLVDWHPEHRKVSYMISDVCDALGITPDIFTYSVTVPNESQRVVFCVPLTKEQLRRKYELFKKIYLSQKVMPITRLKLNERINGYHAGCYAAECIVEYDFSIWGKMAERMRVIESDEDSRESALVNSLQTNLNNLVSVRIVSKELCSLLEAE